MIGEMSLRYGVWTLVVLALAPPARADVLSIDVSGRCDGSEVRVEADGLAGSQGPESMTASACAPGDAESSTVGTVETWESWDCQCTCHFGADEGKSFACGEGSCDAMSQEKCIASGTGVLDVSCDDLAGFDRICVGEGVTCDAPGEGCGPLTGGGNGDGVSGDGGTAAEKKHAGGGCSASLGAARRGILLGFVSTVGLALVALRRRRRSA